MGLSPVVCGALLTCTSPRCRRGRLALFYEGERSRFFMVEVWRSFGASSDALCGSRKGSPERLKVRTGNSRVCLFWILGTLKSGKKAWGLCVHLWGLGAGRPVQRVLGRGAGRGPWGLLSGTPECVHSGASNGESPDFQVPS